jgi:hypothetical protein
MLHCTSTTVGWMWYSRFCFLPFFRVSCLTCIGLPIIVRRRPTDFRGQDEEGQWHARLTSRFSASSSNYIDLISPISPGASLEINQDIE